MAQSSAIKTKFKGVLEYEKALISDLRLVL